MEDEQKVTPIEGQSQEATPEEGQPQDDSQQIEEKSKAFFQTQFQEKNEELKAIKEELAQFRQGESQPQQQPDTPQQQIPETTAGEDELVTLGDLKKVIGEVVQSVVSNNDAKHSHKQAEKEYNKELSVCRKVKDDYAKTLNATPEMVKQAEDIANRGFPQGVGFIGGPSSFVDTFTWALDQLAGRQQVANGINQATSDAEQKVLKMNSVQQPNGSAGGLVETPELTENEQLLNEMNALGGNEAEKEIFGN